MTRVGCSGVCRCGTIMLGARVQCSACDYAPLLLPAEPTPRVHVAAFAALIALGVGLLWVLS